jgi:adsorption protein B
MLAALDHLVLRILAPLATAILICGLDDLFVDFVWAVGWLKSKLRPAARMFPPGPRQLGSAPTGRIAIFVPLWHEAEVIAQMLEHNLSAIRYPDYHVFAGCYPNDPATQKGVASVAARFPNVHLAVCPHDGPTSKADCLNWVYQHMLLFEEKAGARFQIIVTHDAEDMVHPEELRWINYYAARYDFVQTPVLALPTPLYKVTHGVYIDEFSESHTRDMPVRAALGVFVPGCGVGTGYRRDALDRLAEASANRIFEPEALTEDYDNGLRLRRLGCLQAFVPIAPHGTTDFVATREYFPASFRAALRQRTRWVMGISLQSWEKFGWKGSFAENYWLWRDRKGLIANPISVLANVVFVYGLITGVWHRASLFAMQAAWCTLALLCIRTVIRMGCVARIYGFVFSLGVPFRNVYANVLNSAATFEATRRFALARMRGEPLKWLKTEHAYPSRATLLSHKRRIGEILVAEKYIDEKTVESLAVTCPSGVLLGQHLIESGQLTAKALYQALSFQQGLPIAEIDSADVRPEIARSLPKHVIERWNVLPFRIEEGSLLLASPDLPSAEMSTQIGQFSRLKLEFHLIPPREFRSLTAALL